MSGNPAPPLSLDDYRARNVKIVRARHSAIEDFQRHGLDEADAEHDYRKGKAVALAKFRSEGKGVSESEVLAEGEVAGHRRLRDTAHTLRKTAEYRIAELERNSASLRAELNASEGIEWSPSAA